MQIERAVLSKITILNAIIIHFNILMKPMVRSPLLRNVVTAIDKVRLYANTCVMPIGCDPYHSCILTHCQIHTHSHTHTLTYINVGLSVCILCNVHEKKFRNKPNRLAQKQNKKVSNNNNDDEKNFLNKLTCCYGCLRLRRFLSNLLHYLNLQLNEGKKMDEYK